MSGQLYRLLDRFVTERIEPAVYRARSPLAISAWHAPDEPVPFAEAISNEFVPCATGTAWGKPWGTSWFHLTGTIPAQWADQPGTRTEVLVDLGFTTSQPGFQAEGTVYTSDGVIVKAVEPRNDYVPVHGAPGEEIEFYVEASSNPSFDADWISPNPMGDKATAGTEPLYVLRAMDVALLDPAVTELNQEVWTLAGLMRELPDSLPRRAEILRACEDMLDVLDPDDVAGTATAGRQQLAAVLGSPAYASAHRVHAVGHGHIDSAWLWPTRETARKCARTFSNVLDLMDSDPNLTFACSSAQQYAWVQQHYPELFERAKARVAEGRFITADLLRDRPEGIPEPPVWSGEMYLEYHRSTYTSQHRTKAGNRRSEHLLLERPDDSASLTGTDGGTATVSLRPFQICTLRFHR